MPPTKGFFLCRISILYDHHLLLVGQMPHNATDICLRILDELLHCQADICGAAVICLHCFNGNTFGKMILRKIVKMVRKIALPKNYKKFNNLK